MDLASFPFKPNKKPQKKQRKIHHSNRKQKNTANYKKNPVRAAKSTCLGIVASLQAT